MNDRTLVIAEAGVNHNGSLEMALQLVDVAADAGADGGKFQSVRAVKLATAGAAKASYQVANTGDDGSQQAMLRKLEMSFDDHLALRERARQRGIRFMSTAFDVESLDFLATLDMPSLKIPSGDITYGPMLLRAARLRMPTIVSTGMSTLADVEAALGVLAFGLTQDDEPRGRADFDRAFASPAGQAALARYVTILHCVTEYPAPPESVNLRAMDTLAAAFGLPVGYSDHTLGLTVALAAVARGARVIEKHFTLDRSLPGPDHAASLTPEELKAMVEGIRTIESALGNGVKFPAAAEVANRPIARRSIVAASPIAKGETLRAEQLDFKRPGHGISPMAFWDLVGQPARGDFQVNDLLEP
jgi:N-acetylneuraminate synthase